MVALTASIECLLLLAQMKNALAKTIPKTRKASKTAGARGGRGGARGQGGGAKPAAPQDAPAKKPDRPQLPGRGERTTGALGTKRSEWASSSKLRCMWCV